MIQPVTMYEAVCDNCGKEWNDEWNGWCAMGDVSSMKDVIRDEGWHVGDGQEGEMDKTYCPDCWHYDDEDNFCLKPIEAKAG